MAKKPKPILKVEEPKKFAEQKPLEEPKHEAQKPEEFNWGGFLIPSSEKLLMFLFLVGISVVVFAAFVYLRGVTPGTVSMAVSDYKVLLLLGLTYICACYAVERKFGWLWPALLILIPEIIIIIFIMVSMPKYAAPA